MEAPGEATPEAKRAKPPRKRKTDAAATVAINPLFKSLLWINTGLCVMTLVITVTLAIVTAKEMTDAQGKLFKLCEWGFTATLGTFIGLMGGRAAAPDKGR